MSALVVAAVQMTSTEDVAANLERARELVRQAATAGARLVGLPENFAYLGTDRDHRLAIAETLPVREARADAARPARSSAPCRSWPARPGPGCCWAVFPSGAPATRSETPPCCSTRGTVLAAIARSTSSTSRCRAAGAFANRTPSSRATTPVVAETPWGGLGLTICYDLRFPELYRELAARGARMMAVPAAFTRRDRERSLAVLLRARAIENQGFVLAPAQFGFHGGKRRSYGHALVIDPWGVVLAECGDHEGVALAGLDFDYQDQVRTPALPHAPAGLDRHRARRRAIRRRSAAHGSWPCRGGPRPVRQRRRRRGASHDQSDTIGDP